MKLLEEAVTLPPDTRSRGFDGDVKAEELNKNSVGYRYPLYITAKRYSLKEVEEFEEDQEAFTIIALHSTSFHKETWEPTLEVLFELAKQYGVERTKIREVWAIDCPNHGHAGVLNREVLKEPEYANNFGCQTYAEAVHRFLVKAPKAFGVDFGKKRLVGLGHSLGANASLLLQGLKPNFPFVSLIIVEPMVSPQGAQHLSVLRSNLVAGAMKRINEWDEEAAALKALQQKDKSSKWDERVMRAFVKHALTPIPGTKRVTLACTREQELAMYLDETGATSPVDELNRLCLILPIHLILGLKTDYMPREVQNALLDPASGRKYVSVIKMPGVGHLIPQEMPDNLAKVVYDLLLLTRERLAKL